MRGEAFGLAPGRWENTTACPDCLADVQLTQEYPNVWRYQIQHDDSCPWWLDYQRRTQ